MWEWLSEQYAAFAQRTMTAILNLGPYGQAAVLLLFLSIVSFLLLSFSNVEGRWSRLRTIRRFFSSIWREFCLMFQTVAATLMGQPTPDKVVQEAERERRRIDEEQKLFRPVTVGTGLGGPDEELVAELNGFLSRLDQRPADDKVLQIADTWYDHFVIQGKSTLEGTVEGNPLLTVPVASRPESADRQEEGSTTELDPLPADVDEAMRSFWERVNQPRQTVPKYEIPIENLYPSTVLPEEAGLNSASCDKGAPSP